MFSAGDFAGGETLEGFKDKTAVFLLHQASSPEGPESQSVEPRLNAENETLINVFSDNYGAFPPPPGQKIEYFSLPSKPSPLGAEDHGMSLAIFCMRPYSKPHGQGAGRLRAHSSTPQGG